MTNTWPKYVTYDPALDSCWKISGPNEPPVLMIFDPAGIISYPTDARTSLLLDALRVGTATELSAEEVMRREKAAILKHATNWR